VARSAGRGSLAADGCGTLSARRRDGGGAPRTRDRYADGERGWRATLARHMLMATAVGGTAAENSGNPSCPSNNLLVGLWLSYARP